MTDTDYDDQPPGIDSYSSDLPPATEAAERVKEFLMWFGDGRVDELDGPPLFARDLEVLSRLPRVGPVTAPLLATRDTLAEVLRSAYLGPPRPDAHQRAADAILASGVVRDPATLADSLCKLLCDMAGEPRLFIPSEIRAALAAALTEEPA